MTNRVRVTATRWHLGWELELDGGGVTQARTLDKAEQQVRDRLDTVDPVTDPEKAMTDLSRFVYVPGVSEVGDIDLDRQVIHDQSGRRVTESDVEREAAESERTRSWLKPGDKSLSGASAQSPRARWRKSGEPAGSRRR